MYIYSSQAKKYVLFLNFADENMNSSRGEVKVDHESRCRTPRALTPLQGE